MPAGRPLKFSSVEELEKKIDQYFDETSIDQQTITGLALWLDTDRITLCNYEKKDEFINTIKRAKTRIEHAYEMRGLKVGNSFDIFRLKNMGWQDKQEVHNTGEMNQYHSLSNLTFEQLKQLAGTDQSGSTEGTSEA